MHEMVAPVVRRPGARCAGGTACGSNESFRVVHGDAGKRQVGVNSHSPWLSQYRSKQGAVPTPTRAWPRIRIEVPVPSHRQRLRQHRRRSPTPRAPRRCTSCASMHRRRDLPPWRARLPGEAFLPERDARRLHRRAGEGRRPRPEPWAQELAVPAGRSNKLAADFECADGKVTRFALGQGAANRGVCRRCASSSCRWRCSTSMATSWCCRTRTPVTYRGASTDVPALIGKACPALVYPELRGLGLRQGHAGRAQLRHRAPAPDPHRRRDAALDAVAELWPDGSALDKRASPCPTFIGCAAAANAPQERSGTTWSARP